MVTEAGLAAPSLPTPTHASLSVFSWYPFLVGWPQTQAVYLPPLMELSLADENTPDKGAEPKHEALCMATSARGALAH